jgi:ribose transport system permease protein
VSTDTTAPTAGLPAPDEAPPTRLWTRARVEELLIRNSMVLVLLLVIGYFSYESARFATVANLRTILIAAAPFALVALGQTLVILTGGIDLSVGSIIAISAMTGAKMVVGHPERLWVAVAAAIGVGLLAGLINGLIISRLNVAPFVATLGMLTAASGFAYVIGNGAPINGLPPEYGKIANTEILGLQAPVLVMIVGFLVLAAVMKRTAFGLRIYAVGGNRTAAEVAGVNTRRTLTSVYVLSGALAGISGVILSSRVISGPPNLGAGYELDAIAAVVIGGASLMGGRGTVWGTLLGLLLIQTLNNGLDILVVPAYWQAVISGVLIVAAVAVDMWATRRGTT